MFGFLKGLRWGKSAGKAVQVLLKTYDLAVEDESTLNRIQMVAQNFDELGYNEHDVALQFLVLLVNGSDSSNDRQKQLAIKYISRAKGAYKRGLLTTELPLERLIDKAKEKFNINVDNIPAA